MKLKLGATLIFATGALLAIGLSWQLQSRWYMFVLTPFAVWAVLYSFEEIDVDSWHYQLAYGVFGAKIRYRCKGCAYWGAVAAAGLHRTFVSMFIAVLWTIAQLVYHPIITFAWLWGYKPRYWSWMRLSLFDDEKKFYLKPDEVKQRGDALRTKNHGAGRDQAFFSWYMPIILVFPLAILEGVFQIGIPAVRSFYRTNPWYVSVLTTYFSLHAIILLGNLWVRTGWRAFRWFYDSKACPDVVFVHKAKAPAKPEKPATTSTY